MTPPAVHLATDGPIATITLHRAACCNAVDGPTALALREAFERFEADEALRVAVFTGGGGQFCAGADLAAVADAHAPERRNTVLPDGSGPGPMGPTRMNFGKPVIAAVEGCAVAGGLELGLMCDLRVAEALVLARQIAVFPQACLHADRASALAMRRCAISATGCACWWRSAVPTRVTPRPTC